MKAAILRDGVMVVETLPDLTPGPGQILVEPIACGICGTDLHTADHAHEFVASARDADLGGFVQNLDPDKDVVMGHEFSCRVLAVGSGVTGVVEGGEYAAMPFLQTPESRVVLGYSNVFPGGYSDQVLLSSDSLLAIPNGLDPAVAALTEPMAVGLQAVNASMASTDRPTTVVGCGPVGLAIIGSLRAQGIRSIIASDLSAARRDLAQQMGATEVIDPTERELADVLRPTSEDAAPPVVFDAVGAPGMLNGLMRAVPERSQIVVAGICMPPDTIQPFVGVYKRLNVQFVLGWTPEEFAQSLHNLAEGHIDGAAMITGEVGLDGVPQAFSDLGHPDEHVKILVRPGL